CAPAGAQSQPPGSVAPPGLSGVDQYLETLPAARGNAVVGGGAGGLPTTAAPAAAASVGGPPARRAARRLEAKGPDGTAAVAHVAAGDRVQPARRSLSLGAAAA